MSFDKRVRALKADADPTPGPVAYLMARENRVQDNYGLTYAQSLALEYRSPLIVIAPVAADYPSISDRQRWFLHEALNQVERDLKKLAIPFYSIMNDQVASIARLTTQLKITHLVADFNPLRESRKWKERLIKKTGCALEEVDAHNIVPIWEVSNKQEFAAYTIRPKINKRLNEFLTEIPKLIKHPFVLEQSFSSEPLKTINLTGADTLIPTLWKPGTKAGYERAERFFAGSFKSYHERRNDPNADGQSDLSPWLHFGMVSAQRVALLAHHYESDAAALESFLEELIVRRELSDNYCYYNTNYDSFDGFPDWAKRTHEEHRHDPRPYSYTYGQLREARTEDDLWNAAQKQMLLTGKMHGYLRMYWAKKILEWSISPEQALEWANRLNDQFSLDGRDPNGYVGTVWSIGGVHDRAWPEREIFGKIRYMNYNGCKRKFDISRFVDHIEMLKQKGDR